MRSGVTFDARGKTYEWRTNALGNLTVCFCSVTPAPVLTSPQLYEQNSKLPLAWFVSPRNRSTAAGSRAYLALEKEAELIRDDVVAYEVIISSAVCFRSFFDLSARSSSSRRPSA
jgi:hypothetical protein